MIHTASPVPLASPEEEHQVIKPAVDGTLAAMQGAHKHKLKRVVLTSSVAAIQCTKELKDVYNEDDWSSLDSPVMMPYYKSKYLAERVAWDFIDKLPENQKFELVTICPSMIMGPSTLTN